MGRPLEHRRRVTIALAAALALDVGFAVLTTAPAPAAIPRAESSSTATAKKAAATATLHIEKPNVSVRRKGKTAFKPAKEGQKLHVGDTIQTDANGLAQINYTEGSFTRLDVSTTFTIISLTDDQGHRKVNGSLDSGRTWNRTTALTESESFQQQGGGATAAVVGSAFMMQCDASGHCSLISVVDGLKYTTVDGELKLLAPLQECDSTEVSPTNTDLCPNPTPLTQDAFFANQWILANLFLDGLAGFPGPDISGLIVVNNGVVTFTPTPPPPPPNNNPPAGPPAPTVDQANPICIDNGSSLAISTAPAACQNPSAGATFAGQPSITTKDNTSVLFLLNGSTPDNSAFYFHIITLPATPNLGLLYATQPSSTIALADTVTHYAPATTFTYTPKPADDDSADPTTTDSFTYEAVSAADATKTSATATVNITVTEPSPSDESP